MADISADSLNVYVRNNVPTTVYLKIFLSLLNFSGFAFLLWLSFSIKDENPNFFPLVFLVAYVFIIGRYLNWNIFGKELIVISESHVSYQHSYGFWQTRLKTKEYQEAYGILVDNEPNSRINLKFTIYNAENKLPYPVFESALSLSKEEFNKVCEHLENLRLDDLGYKMGFPKINAN